MAHQKYHYTLYLSTLALLLTLLAALCPSAAAPSPPQAPSQMESWSKLTFASKRNGNWEIYSAAGDGSGPTRLTENISPDQDPALTHGSTAIVFSSRRSGRYELYKMDAAGGAVVQLTDTATEEGLPNWSRDKTKIVFQSQSPSNPNDSDIYVINADGSGLTQLTTDSAWDGHPAWAPDSSQIVFASRRSGSQQLWLMNADGSNQHPLSSALNNASYPEWSPDGSRIAFSDDFNSDNWLDIAVIQTDGSGLSHPLGASPASYDRLGPTWSPDGLELAYSEVFWEEYNKQNWITANIYGLDLSNQQTYLLVGSNEDWIPNWQSTDDQVPASGNDKLPAYSLPSFEVQWSGVDNGPAGLLSYDVQYRDGVDGPWTDWHLDTTETSATFNGLDGRTYYFRCRARDNAYNLEPYPGGNGDTETVVDDAPPNTATSSNIYEDSLAFTVSWGGSDAGSGIATYDIQYKDDSAGATWTDWIQNTPQTSATFTGTHGHTYYFQCRARDNVGNLETYPGGDGDSYSMVDIVPPTSVATSIAYPTEPSFTVSWSGTDDYVGIGSYDIQVRDGSTGTWSDWLLDTTATSAVYQGQLGHSYYFQIRARDKSGNLEDYPGGDGDCVSHTPLYGLYGFVRGNDHQSVEGTRLEGSPPFLATDLSNADGSFSLYYNLTGTAHITASHKDFGILPPMKGIPLRENTPQVGFYLPPPNNQLGNSHFEGLSLFPWNRDGHAVPLITTSAHTGDQAVQMGCPVGQPLVTPTQSFYSSGHFTQAGGTLTSPLVVAEIPPGAVENEVIFALAGLPSMSGFPAGTQQIGVNFTWYASLTDGTPLDDILLPVTLTISYRDILWYDAQVDGEDSLQAWRYDLDSANWQQLGGAQNFRNNTLSISTDELDNYALLGTPRSSWDSILGQQVSLDPDLNSPVVSLVYQVEYAEPANDSLTISFIGSDYSESHALSLGGSGWQHGWWTLNEWDSPTITVRLHWTQVDRDRPAGVIVDEITLGSASAPQYNIFLPLVMCNVSP
ncbi:MAG: PD40 domain-containing protein [Chloroflexia bacterium]|nr:PD40 domain-containing protein [Chloroflexia bacterium]